MSNDTTAAAIERFARAHARTREDLSADLPDEEIVQAYAERTEALVQLLEWDPCDEIAVAIRRLVRAQDRIQCLHEDWGLYRALHPDVDWDAEFDRADAEREEAILALMLARPAEDSPAGIHRFYERATKLALLERKDPELGGSSH
jgi:hypothetical protein